MSVLSIGCEPLTPVWTGDAEKKCSVIKETGIIGSLRWWYEAFLRGHNQFACDPSTGTCLYDEGKGLVSICRACQLFGCTGYARRFRLEVVGGEGSISLVEVRATRGAGANHRGWHVPSRLNGSFDLKFLPLFGDQYDRTGISLILRLIERFGALGAKTSQGQGIVRLTCGTPVRVDEWRASLQGPCKQGQQGAAVTPDLRDFFGMHVELVPSDQQWWKMLPLNLSPPIWQHSTWIPTAPAVRLMLRGQFREPGWENDRHRIMGTIGRWGDPKPDIKDGKRKDRTKGSDMFVSHFHRDGDRWRMRVFGFIPSNGSAADRRIRQLLLDTPEFKTKLAVAIGLPDSGVLTATPYPSDLQGLLG